MPRVNLSLMIAFGLLLITETALADEIYKLVDEKGTVHFSDNPAPGTVRSQQRQPLKENNAESNVKLTFGNQQPPKGRVYFSDHFTPAAAPSQKKTSKENPAEITKRLSLGNRQLPKDQMLLYYKNMSRSEIQQEEMQRARRAQDEASQASSRQSSSRPRQTVRG